MGDIVLFIVGVDVQFVEDMVVLDMFRIEVDTVVFDIFRIEVEKAVVATFVNTRLVVNVISNTCKGAIVTAVLGSPSSSSLVVNSTTTMIITIPRQQQQPNKTPGRLPKHSPIPSIFSVQEK